MITTKVEIRSMHEDITILKNNIALIKHILIEEGELGGETIKRLEKSRKIPISKYVKL